MKKIALLVLAAMAIFAFTGSGTYAQSNSTTVTLNAQNGSGQDGTATITGMGTNDIQVVVNLKGGTSEAQPAHIHKGTCASLDPNPLYPLTNVVNGKSTTTVMVGMADLAKGQYAINVHKSAKEVATYVSCGNIEAMMMGGQGGTTTSGGTMSGNGSMPGTGNGDQLYILAGLALVAAGITTVGWKLSRTKA
ncbi:MAG: hypothetical protein M3014_01250 [Chloroflexota bacterium]|nr:hypothetical protein [Chloroflexota bacterium]